MKNKTKWKKGDLFVKMDKSYIFLDAKEPISTPYGLLTDCCLLDLKTGGKVWISDIILRTYHSVVK